MSGLDGIQGGNVASPMPTGGGALAAPEATQAGGNEGYNGVVEAFGNQIEVRNGIADFQGEKFFVSSDGNNMVIDEQDMIIGRIENNQFIEADEAYYDQLRAQGMLEE